MQKSRVDIATNAIGNAATKDATNGLGTGPPLGCCTDSHTTIQDCKKPTIWVTFCDTLYKALICPGLIHVYMTRFSKPETKEFPEG